MHRAPFDHNGRKLGPPDPRFHRLTCTRGFAMGGPCLSGMVPKKSARRLDWRVVFFCRSLQDMLAVPVGAAPARIGCAKHQRRSGSTSPRVCAGHHGAMRPMSGQFEDLTLSTKVLERQCRGLNDHGMPDPRRGQAQSVRAAAAGPHRFPYRGGFAMTKDRHQGP